MIDLHLHTTASDGLLTPKDLVRYIHSLQISACAVTDHDTNEGVAEAIDEAKRIGMCCLSGIELSCLIGNESVHLLGYFLEEQPEPLNSIVKNEIQRWRAERNPKMVEKLQNLGFPIQMNDVLAEANGGQIGRPHLARVLVKIGVVKSVDEAFDLYLAEGRPAYVDKIRMELKDGVQLIHESGGAAILAHPFVYPFIKAYGLKRLVRTAKENGVDGIEAYYSEHTTSQRRRLERYAMEFGLIVTGGSDFHGPIDGQLQPGKGLGNLNVPDELLQPLMDRIEYWKTRQPATKVQANSKGNL
ncbi:MAG: PHP domain-containing protein [bacterium]|nr:PHP domain-containing protein [bacterium]